MRKLRLAVVLSGVAVGLALPAWAVDPPSEQKPGSAAAAQSEQPSTDSVSKDVDSSKQTDSRSQGAAVNGNNAKSRGPTAVMDRATPAEKSPEKSSVAQGNSVKHPPTARMDQATPQLKSPGGATSSSTQASGSEGESPPTK